LIAGAGLVLERTWAGCLERDSASHSSGGRLVAGSQRHWSVRRLGRPMRHEALRRRLWRRSRQTLRLPSPTTEKPLTALCCFGQH